jgi:LPXTG-motif cell wall-anchored protein
LCCDAEEDYCAECCGDADCPKGSICCNKACHEIECCIDDILTGGDPNARCPGDCTCFEGLCVDENQQHCVACDSSKDCPKGECCCKDGTCSDECCPPLCDTDKDCAEGACCCKDGICSKNCCDKPDEEGEPVEKLPSTGVGDDDQGLGMLGAAAIGAAAAYMAGKKLRQPVPEGITVEE